MKKIITLVFASFFITSLFAEKYAFQLKDPTLKNIVFEKLKEKGFSEPLNVGIENFWMVDGDNLEVLNLPIFHSHVNVIESYFSFSTNTILVKLKEGKESTKQKFIAKYNLKNHVLIPNLFSFKSDVANEEELNLILDEISVSNLVQTSQINQVFTLQVNSNDPLYNRQWSISNEGTALQSNGTPDADMEVDSAWTITEGDVNVKIAILDSGVDTLHEDLVNNLLPGFDAFSTDTTDTKGYPTPNFSNDGHGTACAGIVAATANNNLGIAGIAPNCKIVPIRIFYYQDYGGGIGIQATTSTDALLKGSAYAWRTADVDIMSTSAGLSPLFIAALAVNTQLVDEEIEEAFYEARNGAGVAMFFSSGNDDIDDVLWPADLPTTIAVGASSMCDERKNPNDCSPENWGSSYGVSLDVIAPGVRISSTDMTGSNGYQSGNYTATFNGTSAACPNAAGVGALIVSVNPAFSSQDVKAIMSLTADKVANYTFDSTLIHGSWNEEVGYGRVNAFSALKTAETYTPTTVGINDIKLTETFSVYPNPSKGVIWIANTSGSNLDFKIVNVLGAIVQEVSVSKKDKSAVNLNPGIYFIYSSLTSTSIKVIID